MPNEQLERIVQTIRRLKSESTAVTLEENRAVFNEAALAQPLADGTEWEPVRANGVDAEWVCAPDASADRTIFYLRGLCLSYEENGIHPQRQLLSRTNGCDGTYNPVHGGL